MIESNGEKMTIRKLMAELKCNSAVRENIIGKVNMEKQVVAYGIGYGGFIAIYDIRGGYKAVSFSIKSGYTREGSFYEMYVEDALGEIQNNEMLVRRYYTDEELNCRKGELVAELRYKIEEFSWRARYEGRKEEVERLKILRLFKSKTGRLSFTFQEESYRDDGYMAKPDDTYPKRALEIINNIRSGKKDENGNKLNTTDGKVIIAPSVVNTTGGRVIKDARNVIIIKDTFTEELMQAIYKQVAVEAI